MVFSSVLFIFLFLPITLAGYFLIRVELRNVFLLIMSLIFYAWGEPIYVFLILSSITLNYATGIFIHLQRLKSNTLFTETRILILCIIANLALLFYFKYTNFFINNVNIILQYFNWKHIVYSNISLPIGVSFFTFQAMSYVVDVYRKETPVQLNPINLALYIVLFPQLIAGPIVRYHDVVKQIESRTITLYQFSAGIQRFIFGLAKKVLLANSLGEVADKIFAVPIQEVTTGMAWLGIVCYSLQIYFDFSGYSDMAIGLGRLFGFEFLENFNYPYISQSIREFWQRWHISLSTWFRDYVYIPLGGNRTSSFRTYLNLWIVFILCGLWHGASWNFIIWGALHGTILVVERSGWQHYLKQLWFPLRHVYTLLLIMLGWVFFRAETLTQALQYIASMFGFTSASGIKYYAWFYCDPKTVLTLFTGCIFATPIVTWSNKQLRYLVATTYWQRSGQVAIDIGYYGILIALFYFSAAALAAGTYNPFIYFRF